jgi:hypothetical protein
MDWAVYKRSKNALKLHLAFELNRMISVQFICTDANGNERKMLAALLEAGVTVLLIVAMLLLPCFSKHLAAGVFHHPH